MSGITSLHKGRPLRPCVVCDAPRFFNTALHQTKGGRNGKRRWVAMCDTCIQLYKENTPRGYGNIPTKYSTPKYLPKELIANA